MAHSREPHIPTMPTGMRIAAWFNRHVVCPNRGHDELPRKDGSRWGWQCTRCKEIRYVRR